MVAPAVHPFPIKRPGFITGATWIGGPEDMALECAYTNALGNPAVISFSTKGENPGELCLPASTDLNNLGPRARDILAAHLRMACMVGGVAVPGSREFEDVFIQAESNNFQVALGMAKVVDVRMFSDTEVDVDWKVGTGPTYTTRLGHGELNTYTFVPQTQLLVIPGSVEKEFPTYIHDYPSQQLTSTQKSNIVNYVTALELWI